MSSTDGSGAGMGVPRGRPLQAYLAIVLALFVLAAAAGAWYTWSQSQHDALTAASEEASSGATQAARQIGDAIAQVETSVAQLAVNPSVVQAFDAPKGCQLAFALFSGGDGGGHLDVVRSDGTVACSSRPPTSRTDGYAGAAWLAHPTAGTAGPVADARTGTEAISVLAPVASHGVVVAFIDLAELGTTIGAMFGGPRHLVFLLLSADGRTILSRSAEPSRWIGAAIGSTTFADRPGTGADTDVNGVRRIYGRSTVPKIGWRVHAGADRADALASARRLVLRQSLILAVGLLAGLVTTWLVYRRITLPIARLGAAVRTATGGKAGPLAIEGPREVAGLSADFNQLIGEVRRELDERRRAEQDAHELERNYRQLFDSNPHPMFVFDVETLALLEVNDATASYYGHARPDLLGMTLTELSLPEEVAKLAAAVAKGRAVEQWGPLRQVKADGSVVAVMMTSHELSFRGRPARCAVIEDITEKEQLERRLVQSQRLESLGQLAGGVAHDFNNLLSIIIGYATMCAQDVEAIAGEDENLRRLHSDLKQILAASDRATNVTRQLLAFARHDASHTKVLDLNQVVRGVEQLLLRSIGEDIELRTDLTDDPWLISADPGQLEQVLLNLVVNARDAMPTGGTLTIDTTAVTIDEHYAAHHPGTSIGRHMRLRVSDTGTGMSQQTIDRAFEPFFTTKPKGQGTGLGLATIYGIVTRSGGHAQIYSEPGVGTTFTALFPASLESADAATQAPDSDTSSYRAREGETILLAEDEDSLRELNERILVRHGYTVLTATDGIDALDVAESHTGSIDLLLTDVIMPRMSGHDLAVRFHASRPAVPVVYMSGYAEPLLAQRSTLPSGVALLGKPATEHQILAMVRRALDSVHV